MDNTISLDAATLLAMSRDDIFTAMGRSDLLVTDTAVAATVASRRRGAASGVAAADTSPCIVLISAEHNPLA
jgi:hypothetical protein